MSKHYSWQDSYLSNPPRYNPGNIISLFHQRIIHLFLFVLLFASGFWTQVSAEGSKNLYPAGATGNRAYLYSNNYTGSSGSTNTSWPFKTLGTHYVYAKANEVIAVASSAQNMGNGRIRLTAPNGDQFITSTDNIGKIGSRTEELAGPLYPGQATGGNRYVPYTQTVSVAQEGVWKIEFIPSGNEQSTSTPTVPNDLADANWTQSANTELISAWDVSVRNTANNAWLAGRVYTNVFNMHINGSQFLAANAFYGKLFVLTSDGVAYKVTNNGNNGVGFTFFVNNKGFLDASGNSQYKSLDISDPTNANFRVHDPRSPDSGSNVTQKIFYDAPADDLPVSAIQALTTTSQVTTWLKNTIVYPTASNVTYTGIEGTPNLSGNKGANIGFDSNLAGSYRIDISITGFTTRILTGSTTIGTNTIFWDGKDGAGQPLAASTTISEIKVQLFGAEVHFPFIDMEINPGGVIIEQLDSNYNLFTPTKDLVYWDDSAVTGGTSGTKPSVMVSGSTGISSNSNGHKWGSYTAASSGSGNTGTGASSYGNVKSLDTWSFVPGNIITVPLNIVIASADLEVKSIVPSTTTVTIGNSLNYAVTVKNNGPSDVTGSTFVFNVPTGFTITNVSYVTSTGTVVVVNGTIDPITGDYTAHLDMTNGAEIVFTITGTIGSSLGGSPMVMEASIMRPNDVTDPDATNPALTPPTNPHTECLNGTAVENCNNIKYNTITPSAQANLTVAKSVNIAVPAVGQQVIFKIDVTNNGPNNATGVSVTDQLPTGFTYVSHTVTAGTYSNGTGIWTIGALSNGITRSLEITVLVKATGNYTNVATVSGSQTDPTPGDNSDDATSAPNVSANLSIEKIVNNLTPNVGSNVEFTLKATNNGPGNATNIIVTDQLPAGYSYVSHSGGAYVPGTGLWTIGNLANGANTSLIITAKVNAAGSHTNTASIDGTETDPDSTDDTDSAVTTPVNVIDAVNDTATNVNGYTGATNVTNVLTNDKLNGVAVIPSEVTVTEGTGDTTELTINANGSVDVTPGTPAGTYTLNYTLCEKLNPTNCDNASVTVTVVAAPIDAVNDTVTNVNGYTGATNVTNVLTNDKMNGVAVIPSEVTVTEGTGDTTELTINANGSVDVTPGTPAGTYTLNYTLCEKLNPTNCDNASVTVTVVAAPIDAVNDTATNVNGYTGATNVTNVLTNDKLNGVAVIPSEVTVTEGSGHTTELTINANGSVDVTAGTPAGTYTLNYTLCEKLNPTNCDNASVTVTVVAAPIDAVNDTVSNINGYTGGTNVTNVLTNDKLNGVVVIPSEVTVTEGSGHTTELTINANGSVDVTAGTPAGIYTLNYTLCEKLNPTNCDNASVTVTVVAAPIDAVNDTATNINGYTGATNVTNVLTNDKLNGVAVIPSEVTVTEGSGHTTELTINANGSVDVTPGTPAGTYTLNYTLCEKLNPTNCDNASVTVTVVAAPIDAVNDTVTNVNGYTGGTNVTNVLTNDKLNGVAVIPSEVTVTEGSGHTTELTINANGSVDVTPGTPAGTYTLNYTLCEKLNPTTCDNASVTVTVVAAPIDAVNDTASNINGYTGGTNVTNVLTNDKLNGVAVIPSEVTVTEGSGHTTELTINANGSVDVTPGTPAGTYTLNYTLCEKLNPTNCDNASVSVTVVAAPIDAVNDTASNINGYTGGTNVTNVLTNDKLNGVAVIPSEVTVTEGSGHTTELTINANGSVDVTAGTPAGTYTLNYTLCEKLNPTNCDNASVTVTVVAAPIDAVNDTNTNVNGYTGGTNVTNVLTNDKLNGVAVIPSEVTVTEGTGHTTELTINANGSVDVTPGTPAGMYTLNYTLCEKLNPTNCDNASVTVTVVAAPIDAVNDTATNINGYTGGTNVTNVLTNDKLNGVAVIPSEVTVTEGSGHTTELTINANGSVDVTPGTPTGTYTLNYTLCEKLNPTNCDNASVTVTVVAAPIDAVNDTATNINGYTGGIDVVNVLTNDKLNGVTVIPGEVTITLVSGTPELILNTTDGTVDVATNTPGGTYTLTYQICEVLNPTNCETATVTIFVMTPQLTLTKDMLTGTFDSVGDVITYNLVLTNSGNVDITDVVVTDVNAETITPSTVPTIAVGEVVNIIATHTITQADLDRGFVYNTASVTGSDPNGGSVTDDSSDPTDPLQPGDPGYDPTCVDCTVTTITQSPALTLTKDAQAGTFDSVGDVITYDLVLTNSGNVTITDVVIIDTNADSITPSAVSTIAPGEVVNIIAVHTVTQADLDKGFVYNTASVTGNDPKGNEVTDTSSDPTDPVLPGDPRHNPECVDCTITTITQAPALTLTKDAQAGTFDSIGDVITYDLVLTNTGNVTITDLIVIDNNADIINPASIAALAPGASVNITATHTITQADLDKGFVYNMAVVTGNDPSGNPITEESTDPTNPWLPTDEGYNPACPDCTIISLTQEHEMKLLKDAVYQDTNGDGIVNIGDSILYSFSVQNTGNTTIKDIIVEDPLVVVNGGPIVSLAPGAIDNTTFSAVYHLTQADVEKGAVYNLAIADGINTSGGSVNAESEDPTPIDVNDPLFDPACPSCTVVSLTQKPGMALIKVATFNDNNNDGRAQAGETITYSFTVTNTGNVALHNIVVTDKLPGVVLSGGPITILGVGKSDSTTYKAIYTITQADINAGKVSNQATADATTSTGIDMTVYSDDNDEFGTDPTITELNGCTLEIFNAISADGNGENDEFYIGGIECYPDNEVHIYNRWGVLIYDAKGYDNNEKSFKGYSTGRTTVSGSSSVPAGTYFYIIQYKKPDGSTHKKDGYLYITR